MPTSSGKGREILLNSTINTNFSFAYNLWGLYPFIYSQRVSGFQKTQLDLTPIQKQSLNPNRRSSCMSADRRPTGPSLRPSDRSTEPNRKLGMPVGRPCRSTVLLVTVNREVDRAAPVHFVHAGRPGSQPATVLACNLLRSRSFWISISALFLPMSLEKLYHNFLSPRSLQFLRFKNKLSLLTS